MENTHINAGNIDLEKMRDEIKQYENRWIAISEDNNIVANGRTYGETLDKAERKGKKVILFRVPPLDVSLAP